MRGAIAAILIAPLCAAGVSIRMEGGAFTVIGWNPGSSAPRGGWASIFAVYAADGDAPPVLGAYTIEGGSLIFRPRFPLAAGVHARAVFHPMGGSPITPTLRFQKPISPHRRG